MYRRAGDRTHEYRCVSPTLDLLHDSRLLIKMPENVNVQIIVLMGLMRFF